ncbi:alpha/beta hydrolase [Georgenia yuyongxinii]|uniref:Alpha/beta hydrolase n=1 Tax=Georgenia yuyongxinii TaxID=2589797 RepID=A0A552WV87_9MICO|nr:alpha/beta hydrolase [Georgenia yuyongxinii]TRW46615.1 alpha/beta hydrolase [Georgenia yuyongxinii]
MAALTPTVLERVARCATQVHVNGLTTGAQVVLTVDGATFTGTAAGGGHMFDVPPLAADAVLTATQDDGSGPTPPSPAVIVEDAAGPPTSAPLFPAEVGACSQCVHLRGLVPGCEVQVRQAGNVAGTATADRHGEACVPVELRGSREDPGPALTAHMSVCGAVGPSSGAILLPDGPLPAPGVGGPLFGCQRVVPLRGLRRGAKTQVGTDSGTYLGWICNCWTDVDVNVLHPLVPGERVRAQQYWDGDACKMLGPASRWVDVVPPDERIRPTVREALVEGDQLIRVTNQIVGGDLVILLRDDGASPEQRFGPRPASQEPEIALNAPLVAGQQVAVEQHLCGHIEVSDWATVLPAPASVPAPVLLPPLYECAGVVQVAGLYPGAVTRIFQDGIPCGLGWAGLDVSVEVAAAPGLAAGARVTARQWVGGVAGPESDPVTVQPVPEKLHEPRVVGPVALGDTTVWVSGVTPGALVSVYSAGALLGEGYAGEPLTRVGISSAPGLLDAHVRLCDRTANGPRTETLEYPGAARTNRGVGTRDLDYGTAWIPEHATTEGTTDGGYDHPVRGRLYHPVDEDGDLPDFARPRPLVLIAHGLHYADEEDQSHLGYAYLAEHLVRWGMFVFSLDLKRVNEETIKMQSTQQWARGAIILAALDRLFADDDVGGYFNRERIGLVGHSMGGEGVVVAQALNTAPQTPWGIRGVVSLAPTHWRPDVTLTRAKYLQFHGSLDLLLENPGRVQGAEPPFNGFRIYDRAWRPRSFVWVYGAIHQGWNPNWWNSPVLGGPPWQAAVDGALTLAEHAEVARCYVNAFFQDALFGRRDYEGYLHGLVTPRTVDHLEIYPLHRSPGTDLVDDFGDADDQDGLPEETPIDRTANRAGGSSQATGGGLDVWDDTEHVGVLARSVHDTRSTDVAWLQPGVEYTASFPPRTRQPTDALSLQLAQHYDQDAAGEPDVTHNPAGIDLDLVATLDDGAETASVRVGSAGVVPYTAPVEEPWTVFRTVRLPLDAFTAVNQALDLGAIRSVRLRLLLRPTGRVLVDDLEFLA